MKAGGGVGVTGCERGAVVGGEGGGLGCVCGGGGGGGGGCSLWA